MLKTYKNNSIGASFLIANNFSRDMLDGGKTFMFLWNDGNSDISLKIDEQNTGLRSNRVLCATYLQKIQIDNPNDGIKILVFNREFYCVHTNDSEVSCNGLLFFGSNYSPILELRQNEIKTLRTLFSVLKEEFDKHETSQEEMLRILLKRFIIICTRLANKQLISNGENQSEIDLIRHFNVLVEEHFKTKKSVSDYAELLYKSPKTIANVFSKNSDRTPLEVIHERVIIEAKRMLLYTDKTAKQIGYELGYEDPAQFSKLFKKHTGLTTSEFKKTKSEIPNGKF